MSQAAAGGFNPNKRNQSTTLSQLLSGGGGGSGLSKQGNRTSGTLANLGQSNSVVVVEEEEDEVLRGGKGGGPTMSTISPMHSRLQSSTSSSAQKR